MSEMNFLKDINIHNFEESMTITDCIFETMAMAEHEWEAIDEAVDGDYVSVFEAELLGLQEAGGGFVDKCKALGKSIIEMLKKIASYIMGIISKWLVAINNLVAKDATKASEKERCKRGAAKLAEAGKEIKIYGLLLKSRDAIPQYEKITSVKEFAYLGEVRGLDGFQAMSTEQIADIEARGEAMANEIRGALVGTSSVAAGDFASAIRLYMTGHKDTAEYTFKGEQIKSACESALGVIASKAKDHKAKAKEGYNKINEQINKMIKSVSSLTTSAKDIENDAVRDKATRALKATGKLYNKAASVLSTANGIVMNVLSADYRMNSHIVLKCYAAADSDRKIERDAKKAEKEAKKAAETTTQESVESIFGMDLI
jgi:hypothetical protein